MDVTKIMHGVRGAGFVGRGGEVGYTVGNRQALGTVLQNAKFPGSYDNGNGIATSRRPGDEVAGQELEAHTTRRLGTLLFFL